VTVVLVAASCPGSLSGPHLFGGHRLLPVALLVCVVGLLVPPPGVVAAVPVLLLPGLLVAVVVSAARVVPDLLVVGALEVFE